jgi:hypothetical protein
LHGLGQIGDLLHVDLGLNVVSTLGGIVKVRHKAQRLFESFLNELIDLHLLINKLSITELLINGVVRQFDINDLIN